MPFRTWPVLVVAFGLLLLLMAFSGLSMWRETATQFENWEGLSRSYQTSERSLQQIRSDVQVSGLLVRDYLLDPTPANAASYKDRLLANRAGMSSELDRLANTIDREHAPKLALLRAGLQLYWDALDPIFAWTPAEKQSRSSAFLRDNVIPRREAALKLAGEIERLNEANHSSRQREMDSSRAQFDRMFRYAAALLFAIGVLVAVASVLRVSQLEKSASEKNRELRYLSQRVVHAQEEERRSISRELHDEVGQMLTGLRMDVAHLGKLHAAPEEEFQAKIEECRVVLDQTMQSVRDLAMGLRPSMLDDLGLGPALEWQAREFARRYDIPVNLEVEAPLDNLNDTQKISIYRVVQEALTNCARHARAKSIGIQLREQGSSLQLAVVDDGVGLGPRAGKGGGLGLMGIQERVRELGGHLSILSGPHQGTTLAVDIPLRAAGS